jgi:hypothetical protein
VIVSVVSSFPRFLCSKFVSKMEESLPAAVERALDSYVLVIVWMDGD